MNKRLELLVSRMLYPTMVLVGIAGYMQLQEIYPGLLWTAYIPVLIAAIVITTLEICLPYQRHWRPNHDDIKTDTTYMLLVQVGVPLLLGLGLVGVFHMPLADLGSAVSHWWPQHWPLLAQGGLMLLMAEFLSYWLHRFAHTVPLLWRFHAVHHSPDKLYWLNVGRFHPLEKVLQYLVSTFPFMLLGVKQEVLGLYFVFYGMNGFFQHSNIRLQFGLLNYLVSSAELHRWHHSSKVEESNKNYGNNLIVWDLLFGSWFLPRDRKISEVSSGIAGYPQSFTKQLIKPFNHYKSTGIASIRCMFKKLMMYFIGLYLKLRYWEPFVNKAERPAYQQKMTLGRILRRNSKTDFGIKHGFSKAHDEKNFKQQVPIMQYEDIESLLREQESSGEPVLYSDKTLFYARTSGTTGRPKDIPITARALLQFKRQQRLVSCYQYQICPDAFAGKALVIVSPAVEGYSKGGTAYGSVSGHIYKTIPVFLNDRSIVPAEVFEIADHDLKYRVITRLALAQTDITYLGTANPSTFLRIREILNHEWMTLLNSLETGQLAGLESLPSSIKGLIEAIIKPEPDRYKVLQQFNTKLPIEFKDIWPTIRLVTTWTEGNCQLACQQLKESLPADVKLLELGYVASELRATVTCDPETQSGLPILDQVYYEFIDKDNWDKGERETLTITQLEKDKRYYIIVTTDYGLYRYFMNDLVEVSGRYKNTPLLKFIQKGNGVTNITGEKIYEAQVNEAISKSCDELQIIPRFHLTMANVVQARYEVYIEASSPELVSCNDLIHILDKHLSEINLEYHSKRKSGRLRAPHVFLLRRNTEDEYKRYQINRGQREGQYKLISLLEKHACQFPLQDYLITSKERPSYA